MTKTYNSYKKFSAQKTENLKSQFEDALKLYLTGWSFTNLALLAKKN